MKKIRFSFLALMLVVSVASAQRVSVDTSIHFGITALVKENSVVLRWAPRSYAVWRLANKTGYMLERAELPENAPEDWRKLSFQKVPGTPFKPYTLADWKTRTDTTNVAIGTAAQALYGQPKYAAGGATGIGLLNEQSNEQALRFSFALHAADLFAPAADGLALRFEDRSLDKTKQYVYRISNVPSTKGFVTDTAYVMVSPEFPQARTKVLSPFLEEGDGSLKIWWSRSANHTLFNAFFVEKSTDSGKTFKRLNERPLLFTFNEGQEDDFSFVDSLVVNGREYQYRIVGLSSFAEEGLPSEVVKGMGKDLTGPTPPTELWAKDVGQKMEVSWKADHTLFADHAGWFVGRSLSANGPFAPLTEKALSKETRRFVDENPVPLMTNYYVVFAIDDKNNLNMSPAIAGIHHDAEPPAKPIGLTGLCDSNGLITLQWTGNKEPDLQGYRVFAATAQNREWFQITSDLPIEPIFQYQVALNSLTEKMYFTVVALDFHFNASDYASTAEVILPDTIAPEKPLITEYSADEKGIHLKWAKSGSTDAVKTVLLRRSGSETWKTLVDVTGNKSNTFSDTSARRGIRYEYALETFDDAGLSSGKTRPMAIAGSDNGIRPGVSNLKGQYDKAQKQFSLAWEYKPQGRYNFVIYRGAPGQDPENIGQVSGAEHIFADTSLIAQKDGYDYSVKVIWADGGESDLSKPVEVRFTKGK